MGVFIKFDKIVGECRDKGLEGYSPAESAEFGLTKSSEGSGGQSRRRGDVKFNNMTVTRLFDSASPVFTLAVARGTIFGSVHVVFTASYETTGEAASGAPTRQRYIEIMMEDVLVFSHTCSGNADESPTETLELNFTRYAVRYIPRGVDGVKKPAVMAGWDADLCQDWAPKSWGGGGGGGGASASASAGASFSASASASLSF